MWRQTRSLWRASVPPSYTHSQLEFDEAYSFTDQPEFDPSEYDAEIERDEFLALWSAALRQGKAE